MCYNGKELGALHMLSLLIQQTDLSLLGHTPEVGIPARLVAHLPTTTTDVTQWQWRFPGIVQGDLQKDRK